MTQRRRRRRGSKRRRHVPRTPQRAGRPTTPRRSGSTTTPLGSVLCASRRKLPIGLRRLQLGGSARLLGSRRRDAVPDGRRHRHRAARRGRPDFCEPVGDGGGDTLKGPNGTAITKIFVRSAPIGCPQKWPDAPFRRPGRCCLGKGLKPYVGVTRPATPRTKSRLRTAHPGGFLVFRDLIVSLAT